jgi:2-oxoglutarate dehydrogenase E2 component (dihydrolipoamide succinyltransferase)
MAQFELVMPKMGESVAEATIIKWLKKPGDSIELDEPVLEIATDKVDSEIPSPVAGILEKYFSMKGKPFCKWCDCYHQYFCRSFFFRSCLCSSSCCCCQSSRSCCSTAPASSVVESIGSKSESGRFYSPLVRNIAKEEKISMQELDSIPGTGKEGRVTKDDLMNWLSNRKPGQTAASAPTCCTCESCSSGTCSFDECWR